MIRLEAVWKRVVTAKAEIKFSVNPLRYEDYMESKAMFDSDKTSLLLTEVRL